MAFIPGVSTGINPQVIMGSGAAAGPGAAGNRGGVIPGHSANALNVVDGTPVRVVVLALAASASLWALKIAGFRFNIGVSGGR
jgi:hypothetical protein